MYGDIYPTKYIEKATDTFLGRNFGCHKTQFQAKTCTAGRASNIELSMLVLNFMVKYRLKILDGISVESMECFNKDA